MSRPRFDLTEKEVRYIMSIGQSNTQCAKLANVSYNTWKQYAKMYVDSETGKTLFDLQKEKYLSDHPPKHTPEERAERKRKKEERKRKIESGELQPRKMHKLEDILAGKHPKYPTPMLKARLKKRPDIMKVECSKCGFKGKTLDGRSPLILDHINYNWKDHRIENLRWMCLNCYSCWKGLKPTIALKFGRIMNARFGKKLKAALQDEAALIAFARQFERRRDEDGQVYWVTKKGSHVPDSIHDEEKGFEILASEIRAEAMDIINETEPERLDLMERLDELLYDELGDLPPDIQKARQDAVPSVHNKEIP